MNELPNYMPPHPDELMFSWIYRLARANALTVSEFSHAYCGTPVKRNVKTDIMHGFFLLYGHLPVSVEMDKLFMSLTTMGYEMIAASTPLQSQCFNVAFQPYGAFNRTIIGRPKQPIKICPKCMREDIDLYGRPYIHRSHQLTGVDVCYKHHVPLMAYHGKTNSEMAFDMDDYSETEVLICQRDAAAYAEYAHGLLDENICTDIISVRDITMQRLGSDGYDTSDLDKSFFPCFDSWKYNSLTILDDYKKLFKPRKNKPNFSYMQAVMPVLMYLWPDPHDFAKAASGHAPYLQKYTCRACGKTYYETPQSQKDGWGCPYCGARMPDVERFE